MQRFFVEGILNKIAADLPQFETVGLFNDQFDKLDNGTIDSLRFPALFISFPDGVEYDSQGGQMQRAPDLTVRFYIADELTISRMSISKTVLEVFDLKQEVFKAFNSKQVSGTNTTASSFVRINEETDENRTNYYVFIQDYRVNLIDSDTWIRNRGTEYTIPTLQINDEIIINPASVGGVRTAKDVNDG